MNAITTAPIPQINMNNGKMTTTSRNIAQVFGKRHSDVLRDIKTLVIPQEFRERNFALSSEIVAMPRGGSRSYKMHRVTRDGFTLLAMGFTGSKAMQFKLGYIEAFNSMEAELVQKMQQPESSRLLSASELRRLRAAIFSVVHDGYAKAMHQTMFNRIYGRLNTAFGITAASQLPVSRLNEALDAIQAEWVPDAGQQLALPDGMVLVSRQNLKALNNRCQLASTRYKAIHELERRAARLVTDAEELRRQMVDFRYLTIDPVHEASAIVAGMISQ